MLEKMDEFFNSRLDGYEEHQLNVIEGAKEFYPYTASLLLIEKGAKVLDLGCGTGLELDYYFALNPTAKVTGIDLAADMLKVLKDKFADKAVTLIQGSYFDVPFEENSYEAIVSVESLHHFTQEQQEIYFRQELLRLKVEHGINDNDFYHYDTPLTVEHEIEALKEAGFTHIEVLKQWAQPAQLRQKSKFSVVDKL